MSEHTECGDSRVSPPPWQQKRCCQSPSQALSSLPPSLVRQEGKQNWGGVKELTALDS